jgi:hypothetical protein
MGAGGAALKGAMGPTGQLSGVGDWLKGAGTTAAQKLGEMSPELALGAGQMGMQAYAGEQAGAMQDERFRLEQGREQYGREEDERQRRLAALRMMTQGIGSFANV